MKFSQLSKINRGALNEKISEEAFALAHERALKDSQKGKFENDNVNDQDLNDWLAEQTKDLDESEVYFLESAQEQKAHFHKNLRNIADGLDKKSVAEIETFKKQDQQNADSLKGYIVKQNDALKKALSEKHQAKKDYIQKFEQLKQLSEKHKALMQNHVQIQIDVNERQKEVNELKIEAQKAANRIVNYYTKSDNNFNTKASATISPADYALQRDSQFQSKLETMSDASRQAKDPDVRERIEIEIVRQRASYAIDQNQKIEGLTGQSRGNQISQHEVVEKAAAIRAAELDVKLQQKGIKVDFDQGAEPDIRQAQDEDKQIAERLQNDLQVVRSHQFKSAGLDSANSHLNDSENKINTSGQALDTQAKSTAEARQQLEISTAKTNSLGERIRASNAAVTDKNSNVKLSSRQVEFQQQAREAQHERELERAAAIQQAKQQEQTHGSSLR